MMEHLLSPLVMPSLLGTFLIGSLLSLAAVAALLSATGLYCLFPREASPKLRIAGIVLSSAALLAWAVMLPAQDDWFIGTIFLLLAGVVVVAAAAVVVVRSPSSSVLAWSIATIALAGLLLTGGLGLLELAIFALVALGVALFAWRLTVLTGADGQAKYDGRSWESHLAAGSGALLCGILTLVMVEVATPPELPPDVVQNRQELWKLEIYGEQGVLQAQRSLALAKQLGDQPVLLAVLAIFALTGLAGLLTFAPSLFSRSLTSAGVPSTLDREGPQDA